VKHSKVDEAALIPRTMQQIKPRLLADDSPSRPEQTQHNVPVRNSHRGSFFAGYMAFGFDLARVEKALRLQARKIGHRQFEVAGGETLHYVDLAPRVACPCDCGDHVWRGDTHLGPCKHVLRALLAEGDADVLLAVAALLTATREYAEALERQLRPRPIRITQAVKAHVSARVGHPSHALAFDRQSTGIDASVRVTLARTGLHLGMLVRDGEGVSFLPERDTNLSEAA
jgi:hypothetical protein